MPKRPASFRDFALSVTEPKPDEEPITKCKPQIPTSQPNRIPAHRRGPIFVFAFTGVLTFVFKIKADRYGNREE